MVPAAFIGVLGRTRDESAHGCGEFGLILSGCQRPATGSIVEYEELIVRGSPYRFRQERFCLVFGVDRGPRILRIQEEALHGFGSFDWRKRRKSFGILFDHDHVFVGRRILINIIEQSLVFQILREYVLVCIRALVEFALTVVARDSRQMKNRELVVIRNGIGGPGEIEFLVDLRRGTPFPHEPEDNPHVRRPDLESTVVDLMSSIVGRCGGIQSLTRRLGFGPERGVHVLQEILSSTGPRLVRLHGFGGNAHTVAHHLDQIFHFRVFRLVSIGTALDVIVADVGDRVGDVVCWIV